MVRRAPRLEEPCFSGAQHSAAGRPSSDVREGGTFRVNLGAGAFDPSIPLSPTRSSSWAVLNPVCGRLMTYPGKPPPAGTLAPEVAKTYPRVSAGRQDMDVFAP